MTDSKSITIHKEWLEKIKAESMTTNKDYTALIFNFGPDTENYVIINLDLFKLVLATLEAQDDTN